MTILCNDNTYVIYYTEADKGTISIPKKTVVSDILDITLVGKDKLDYGQIFDENLLRLLENFASPESSTVPGTPDPTATTDSILSTPTPGQLWFNTTQKRLFVHTFGNWLALASNDDYGGASGVIADGQRIPLPVSAITGTPFTYDDCSWSVSPFYFPDQIDFMDCYTDPDPARQGYVIVQYKLHGDSVLRSGYANYQIIGIRNNRNTGIVIPPT